MGDQEQPVGGAPPPADPAPAQPGAVPPPPPPPAPLPKERKWLPTIAVFLVAAFVSLGGFIVVGEGSEAFEDPEAVVDEPTLGPIDVGAGVSIRPLEGWEIAGQGTDPPSLKLTQGTGTLDVFAFVTYPGGAEDLWHDFVANSLAPQATSLETATILEPFVFDNGLTGVHGFYTGSFTGVAAPIEGDLTAVITPAGTGVVFDGWAELGSYSFVAQEVAAMVRTMQEA